MCTVTFLPLNNSDFVLTSNRDEQTIRKPALSPTIYNVHNSLLVFPKDLQAEGTWIATSGIQFTLCLLNGAFKKHERKGSYRKSRGLMLLDFFKYNNVNAFLNGYDFNDIEPFTLLILNTGGRHPQLTEVRWDGEIIYPKEIDTTVPHIWSSATLYNKETIAARENWFTEFLSKQTTYNENTVLDFHHFGGNGDRGNSLVMNRDNVVRTVSITSIARKNNLTNMIYKDVINEKLYSRRIC
ncbi:MAG: NRDE family protein [Bacteroidia bacterium]